MTARIKNLYRSQRLRELRTMDNASKATLSQQSRLLEVLHKHCPEYYDYNDSRMWDFTETLTKRHASELITEYYDGKVDRLKAEFYQFIKERKEQ